ncbi:Peroxiredoxin [Methanocorpusculaceae archaeon Cs1]|uniref:Peroxiredoxin n=2 Tax=Methanorbis rubei TaxID=3028300 RepID=A0AAE4MGL6_9EURY|nr:Peroxiredoxin [Methanocorpusculaceae archaeon Cs1]
MCDDQTCTCDSFDNECDCVDYYHEMPRLGEPAPEFVAETTHGQIKLSDYKDKKWVVLFSHPADFTPVCTTEFAAFSKVYPEFEKRNVALIGLSIDSASSHLAWIKDIKEKLGVAVPFPVIADLDTRVASLYGMIQPAMSTTAACRAVFFIDPHGVLRAMIYYPLTTGRYVPEILRVIDALQVNEKYHVATPANWQPGDKVIVPAPRTQAEMEEREKISSPDKKTWYLLMKDL